MDELWSRAFADWSQTGEHRWAVSRALVEIERALARLAVGEWALVSVSGGKDSLCAAHLARRVDPSVRIFHWDYGARLMPREVEEDLQACIRALGGVIWIERREDYSAPFHRIVFGHLQPRWREQGCRVVITGLRAEESGKRRRRMAIQRSLGVIPECWPLRQWRWLDVWAYIVAHGLRYPKIYDSIAAIDGWERARLSVIVTGEEDAEVVRA